MYNRSVDKDNRFEHFEIEKIIILTNEKKYFLPKILKKFKNNENYFSLFIYFFKFIGLYILF